MNKKTPTFCIITVSLLLFSCEESKFVVGSVKDSSTEKPIDSVLIEIEGSTESTYTDSLGNYFITKELDRWIPDYPTLDIRLSKKGYLPLRQINPDPTKTIYLTPKE